MNMATVDLIPCERGQWQYAHLLDGGIGLPNSCRPTYPSKAAALRAAAAAGYTHYQLRAHWGRIPKQYRPSS